jgi:hypothetical protein
LTFASNRRSRLRQKGGALCPALQGCLLITKGTGGAFCIAASVVAPDAFMDRHYLKSESRVRLLRSKFPPRSLNAPRILRDGAKGYDKGRRPAPAPSTWAGCSFNRCYRYCAASMSTKSGGAQVLPAPRQALLLHGNREVCAPGKVNLVANLHFIEHRRIGDTSAVFPTVRPNEAD